MVLDTFSDLFFPISILNLLAVPPPAPGERIVFSSLKLSVAEQKNLPSTFARAVPPPARGERIVFSSLKLSSVAEQKHLPSTWEVNVYRYK